jgi:ATP-dependent RNA helicase MSS116
MSKIATDVRRKAYVGWLGHTNARCKVLGWSKQELVDNANTMAREDYLLREIPPLTPRAVGFMGLKNVRNLNVERQGKGKGKGGGKGRGKGGFNGRGRPR